MAKRICQTCSTEFESRKVKAYCSKKCDPTRHKKCLTCGVDFVDMSRTNQKSYCSDACNPSTRKTRKKTCSHCAKPFEDDSKQNSMTYCSETCRRKAKVLRLSDDGKTSVFLDEQTRTCDQCRSRFTPASANQVYCSVECREHVNREENYKDVPPEFSRKVQCFLCQEDFFGCIPHGGRSGNHFEEVHGTSTEEYQSKFPQASIYCDASIWKQKQKTWTMTPEQLEVRTEHWREYYAKNETWNKGLTAEDHPSLQAISEKAKERLSDPTANPFYGRNHSEETKQILSEKHKALKKDPIYCRNWLEAKQLAAKLGAHLSKPHAVLIQALRDVGVWDMFEFEYEKWLTLPGGLAHGIDICTKTPKKIAIEVDGCYYHGCPEHGNYDKLKGNRKLEVDQQRLRDEALNQAYEEGGWTLLRVWEHDLKDNLSLVVESILVHLENVTDLPELSYTDIESKLDSDLVMALAAFVEPDCNLMSNEEVLTFYRLRGFPYPRYSSEIIHRDFKKLCEYEVSEMRVSDTEFETKVKGLGMKASKFFMRNFFEASARGRRSCLEVFKEDASLLSVIESRRKHARKGKITDATMRTGLQIRASAPASFPASVAKYVYAEMGLKSGDRILDPCAGFGGRYLGAMASDLNYVGVDPWTENVANLREMGEALEVRGEILHNPFEDVELEGMFDGAFTSPPHFNKETYTEEETQSLARYTSRESWVKGFLHPMIQKVFHHLKDGATFVLHVSEFKEFDFPGTCEDLMRECGFEVQPRLYWRFVSFLQGGHKIRKEPFVRGIKPPPLQIKHL